MNPEFGGQTPQPTPAKPTLLTQPGQRKVFQVLLGVMALMGLLKFFGGLFGFIEGAFIIVVAGFGWWGSFFNHKRAMFLFLFAVAALFVTECVYFGFKLVSYNLDTVDADRARDLFQMVLSIVFIVYYIALISLGYRAWKGHVDTSVVRA